MAVKPSPFFDPNLSAPQSELSLSRLQNAVKESFPERYAKVDAMRVEIDMLVDHLVHMVEAEKAYHIRVGLFAELTSQSAYGSTSAPELNPENRSAILRTLRMVDPREEVKESPTHAATVPAVTVGILKAIDWLAEVDRDIRLYSHRVKFTKLQIQKKLIELDALMEEAKATSGEQV
jgi:ABC-type histidine transport system ATPase subunit